MKKLLMIIGCLLILSAGKHSTKGNESSETFKTIDQSYTYIKYRQKVNGYEVSAIFLNDSIQDGCHPETILGKAILSFRNRKHEIIIVNPSYTDNNLNKSVDSIRHGMTIETDYIPFEMSEDNTFSGNESPFFFFDIDFDSEKELIVCLWEGMPYHGHAAYKAYKTKIGNGSHLLSPMQGAPFNELNDYTKIDTINQTISIPIQVGLKMGGLKVYGLVDSSKIHSLELKELIKYDWKHTDGMKYSPCNPNIYYYKVMNGIKELDRIEKCPNDTDL